MSPKGVPGKATGVISQTYFQDEKYDIFLLKLQWKMTNFFRSVYIAFPAFYTGPYTKRSKNFFQNTSFPYFKRYQDVRKHISDTSRHSRRVQNTILISKTYFGDENGIFGFLGLREGRDRF